MHSNRDECVCFIYLFCFFSASLRSEEDRINRLFLSVFNRKRKVQSCLNSHTNRHMKTHLFICICCIRKITSHSISVFPRAIHSCIIPASVLLVSYVTVVCVCVTSGKLFLACHLSVISCHEFLVGQMIIGDNTAEEECSMKTKNYSDLWLRRNHRRVFVLSTLTLYICVCVCAHVFVCFMYLCLAYTFTA